MKRTLSLLLGLTLIISPCVSVAALVDPEKLTWDQSAMLCLNDLGK